jgi:hypothetical protein
LLRRLTVHAYREWLLRAASPFVQPTNHTSMSSRCSSMQPPIDTCCQVQSSPSLTIDVTNSNLRLDRPLLLVCLLDTRATCIPTVSAYVLSIECGQCMYGECRPSIDSTLVALHFFQALPGCLPPPLMVLVDTSYRWSRLWVGSRD